jgi:GNAT superfamily N-acetyltransferase
VSRTVSMSTGIFFTNGGIFASWYHLFSSPSSKSILIGLQAVHPETSALIGVIINKLEPHQSPRSPSTMRGYIAMLAVSSAYRNQGIATTLVRRAIDAMVARDADEVVLETEVSNTAAMKLYERLGFLRSKKLHRYYLNGNTAYRLVLLLKSGLGRSPLEDGLGNVEGNRGSERETLLDGKQQIEGLAKTPPSA